MSTALAPSDHRTPELPHPPVLASVVRWPLRVLAWGVILVSFAALTAAVLVPRLGGATPYAVLTGSMEPGLPPGTLVVMRPVPVDQLSVGKVVTYQLYSGEPTVVTHRIVQVQTDLNGRTLWQTQGDANNAPDERWVRAEQIRGTLWYAVPQLGRANILLNGPEHELLVYGAAALLALYAGSMFASAAWTRGRDRRRADPS